MLEGPVLACRLPMRDTRGMDYGSIQSRAGFRLIAKFAVIHSGTSCIPFVTVFLLQGPGSYSSSSLVCSSADDGRPTVLVR